ncbi:hypothetical protein Cantr_01677 [Candida viswanathii]|uniref:Uncharacterized protein n=1 Tax=Candida viswanathii TaxID=5486 RepID=A0A367YKE5_9ASCO|nr:hypothetical protein Cantr_01677 [Candida viswanathii]
MSSTTSLDTPPNEPNQVAGLTTGNHPDTAITTTTGSGDATLKQTDIPRPPQQDNNPDGHPPPQEKKQTVFEIAQGIEENLNRILKQLDTTDVEINTRVDLALKNINSLYDKSG